MKKIGTDYETARKIGSRHGKPVVYKIDAKKMQNDGVEFYLSLNGIWLVSKVPIEYMKKK